MLEDRLLLWKFKRGSRQAFRLIYGKYAEDLLALALKLLGDRNSAEDVVQDVFVSFVGSIEQFRLRGSLKGYLATCVANRARDYLRRAKTRLNVAANKAAIGPANPGGPLQSAIYSDQIARLGIALTQLPYEQREAVLLHLQGDLRFRQIAELQKVSVNTAHSRYRYGLEKLRSMLNGEVKK